MLSCVRLKDWFTGPALQSCELQWPTPINSLPIPDNVELERTSVHVLAVSEQPSIHLLMKGCCKCFQLLKAVDCLHRFMKLLTYRLGRASKSFVPQGFLSLREIPEAEKDVFRIVQRQCYSREISRISGHTGNGAYAIRPVEGTLKRLCPVLLDDLLCVGSKLDYSTLDSAAKYPTILRFTEMPITFYHLTEGHSGVSQVLASTCRKYWVVQDVSAVKRVIGRCWTCKRKLATVGQK